MYISLWGLVNVSPMEEGQDLGLDDIVTFVVSQSAGNTLPVTLHTVMSKDYTVSPPSAMLAFAYD